MLNIQSLIKFPVPKVRNFVRHSKDIEVDKFVYETYRFTDEEVSYIESKI